MHLIIQICVVFGVYWLAQCVEFLLPFPFPASVISLLLLLLLLLFRVCKVERLREITDFLLGNLTLFFVPAVASLVNYFDLIRANLIPFAVIVLLSSLLTFGATAAAVTLVMRLLGAGKEADL